MTASTLPERLGNAVCLGRFESNSPEWNELRSGARIGGSEVATICGLNPWESPFTLWAKKTQRIDSNFEISEAMEWGHRLEPVVLEKFKETHPELSVDAQPGTYANVDRDWQIANPDAIAFDPETCTHTVVEIKTARYEDDWLEGVPPYYKTQVQWYMQTLGFSRAIVAVLFSGSKYREFEVLADEFEQSTNLSRVVHWRELYLLRGEQPNYDGMLSTYETIRQIHPDIDPELPDVHLDELGVAYRNALAEYEKAEAQLNELKSHVMDAMGKAKRGLAYNVHIVTRQARAGGRPYLVNKKG